MAPKVNAKKDNKVSKTVTAQIKQEVIENNERGVKTSALPQSTISMIIEQEDRFKAVTVKDALANEG